MTTTNYIEAAIILFCIYWSMTDSKNAKTERLHQFHRMADDAEDFLLNRSDRFNVIHANLALEKILLLKKDSFCRQTERVLIHLESIWRAKFLAHFR